MTMFAWLWLLGAATSVDLVDEVYQIPADEWRYVEVTLRQQPARLEAEYRTQGGSEDIRVALLRSADLERLRHEEPHGVLAMTPAGASGRLRFHVADPGHYAVVLDNRGDTAAKVHLRVWLDFAAGQVPQVTMLSPRRQMAIILISFGVFFGIVTWSARRLLRAVKR